MNRICVIGRDQVPAKTVLAAGQKLEMTLVVLPGCRAGNLEMEFCLEGEGAELDLAGLYLCSGTDNVSINVSVRHTVGGCYSRQLLKGIVSDESKFSFDGLIYVAKDAQKTRAYQENHSILLSPSAVAGTRPQLEIYADDVECSHGATVGSLDEDVLFYMQSRGISADEARRLQILSFLSPVLSRLGDELQKEVRDAL